MSPAIRAEQVGIRFQFGRDQRALTPGLTRLRRGVTEAWGIRGVSFEIRPGEAVALLGPSGSGKSTLLRTLGGIFLPDEGSLRCEGVIGTLLATDAGLSPVLTGRENAALVSVLAGRTRAEARASLDRIAERAGLGSSFERPVMSYSEGMRARVGFAVAMDAGPDVLLLDEVHEALDHAYRDIVERECKALLARGGIVVAAGHDHPLLERIATRALLLDGGALVDDGAFADVQRRYLADDAAASAPANTSR